jgi:tryptophan halogenase
MQDGLMDQHAIRKVIIVGGGTAGWMAAAGLSTLLDEAVEIVLIESDEIGTVGVGEATIPPLIAFNNMIGVNEDEFLAACQGTFKLGIEFVDWGAVGERYFHPFGPHGQDFSGVHFHQLYLREAQQRPLQDIREWSMSAVAAELGRFARPGPDARLPLSQLVYAFHFDAGLYGQFLRRHAEAKGVKRIEGKIVDVVMESASGNVAAVTLTDGRSVEGELFIDCSGFRGLLIEQKLETGYDDWSRWLPCDRAVAVQSKLAGPAEPFTRSTARAAGWQWRIPLQHRMGNGLVYSSAHLERDAAEQMLLENLEAEPLIQPRHLGFTAGCRRKIWNANVISLGLASGFIEPLESTSIHLVQVGISKLVALFPDRRFNPAERDEYNRQIRDIFEDIRDFIVLHYKATRRSDSAFWNYCKTMEIPDKLAAKLELWRSHGRIFREGAELFGTPSWVAVLLGQGIVPDQPEPAVGAIDVAYAAEALAKMRESYRRMAEHMPTHADFIAQACPADKAPVPA